MKRRNLMKQIKWIGVFVTCATMVCGKQDPYYLAIATGNGLFLVNTEKTAKVSMTSSVPDKNSSGLRRHDFVIDETPVSVIMTNGIITAMTRNGKDLGIKPPELKLDGNKEWIELSKHYYAETLRLLSFTRFLNLCELAEAQEIFVIGEKTAKNHFRIFCETSNKNRLFGPIYKGELSRVSESVKGKQGSGSYVGFDVNDGSLANVTGDSFKAEFFSNGGLKRLVFMDSKTRKATLQKWDEKGNLIADRDLQKDPIPDPFENGLEIKRRNRITTSEATDKE